MAGSPCPIETMKKVRTLMHMEQVTICYGMTETSHHSYQSDRLRFVKVKDRMEFEDRLVGLVREWMGSDDEVDYRRSVGLRSRPAGFPARGDVDCPFVFLAERLDQRGAPSRGARSRPGAANV